jgi:hypothetical protein
MKKKHFYQLMILLALVVILGLWLPDRETGEELLPPAAESITPETDTSRNSSMLTAEKTHQDGSAIESGKSHRHGPPDGSDPLQASTTVPETGGNAEVDAQEEFEDLKREMFDEEASTVLPLLSVQSFRHSADPQEEGSLEGPQPQFLPVAKSGPFGRLAPPDGHVWIRIDADHAREYAEIMAQTADLYRAETGYAEPVTVLLWVGGRPYSKQVYSDS